MHAERDYLVRFVFPELRERCTNKGLELLDIDLRWGVTEEEAEQGKVLDIIFDEINRSRPFFIGLLGERYGHPVSSVPQNTKSLHPWLVEYPEHSFTALEIIHGVLRNPALAHRSFFYFRDPKVIPKIPQDKRQEYLPENSEAAGKIASLKDKIRAAQRPVLEDYPCQWDNLKDRITGLDYFGQQVLEDLWKAICSEYPQDIQETDPLLIERHIHDLFASERSHLYVGRQTQKEQLTEYVQCPARKPIVILGESGCGKSAFLGDWYLRYQAAHPDECVLAYFVGASPDSANHFRLLRNICAELRKRFNLRQEVPAENEQLSKTLAVMLVAVSEKNKRVTLILDALDQLSPIEASHSLGWLLNYIPEKVKLVVSTLDGDCLKALRRRKAIEINLPMLSVEEQRKIIELRLNESRRKLDASQIALLLAHPGVKNPLYLRVALEELRLFGKFEELSKRINALPEDIVGLFEQVLERLEDDHGVELVSEALTLLGSSRFGLSELELLDLLQRSGEERLPRILWIRLARNAGAYLVQRGELIGFFHRQLYEAVERRYLKQEKKHKKLANYFEKAQPLRKLEEFPYQLQLSENWAGLEAALSDLDFFSFMWDRGRKFEWIAYWRALKLHADPEDSYRRAIEARLAKDGKTEEVALLSSNISQFLKSMALFVPAANFESLAIKIWEDALEPDNPKIVNSLINLARIYKVQDQYSQAQSLFERALNILRSDTKAKPLVVASCSVDLADSYFSLDTWAKGTDLFFSSEKIYKTQLGPFLETNNYDLFNLERSYDLIEWAKFYIINRQPQKALPLYERALAIQEHCLGNDNLEVGDCIFNMGFAYYELSKFPTAESFLERALSIFEDALGPKNILVARTLTLLGHAINLQKRYSEALEKFRKALAIIEVNPDASYFDKIEIHRSMAVSFRMLNECENSLVSGLRAFWLWREVSNRENENMHLYSLTLFQLANSFKVNGNLAKCISVYKRTLKLKARSTFRLFRIVLFSPFDQYLAAGFFALTVSLFFGYGQPVFKASLILLIIAALRCFWYYISNIGKKYEGLEYENRAEIFGISLFMLIIPLFTTAAFWFGLFHPIAAMVILIVIMWTAAHSLRNGSQYLTDLYVFFVDYIGFKILLVHYIFLSFIVKIISYLCFSKYAKASAFLHLSKFYRIRGKYAKALAYANKGLKIFTYILGINHPDTAVSFAITGNVYFDQEDYSKAEPFYQQAIQITEQFGQSSQKILSQYRAKLKTCKELERFVPKPYYGWDKNF
ncbi:MAG: tetratricopeptide repeat protein [Candidatus Omnitrophica bacterium]|nr:tetratricopeptide repeat protein [Candidatus Omnitrophota bacterium]